MINNLRKSNNFNHLEQIVAGVMPNDNSIEFNAVKKAKQVLWLQNGTNHYFADLPLQHLKLIKDHYLKNKKAIAFLSKTTNSFHRQLELYTYYMWGSLDSTPDIKNGQLSAPENFRDTPNCPSLLWDFKQITINGHALDQREIMITDMFMDEVPNKTIAMALNISESYLNDIISKMYKKASVETKPGYLKVAIQNQVV